jgi:hypothetical protein
MSADAPSERGMAIHTFTEAFDADPMDEAAFRMLDPADGPGEFARVVYLDTAKRIRDEAVEHAFAQGAAHAVAGANETAAALIAGIDQALEEASTASMLAASTILDGEFVPKPVDHIGGIEGTD